MSDKQTRKRTGAQNDLWGRTRRHGEWRYVTTKIRKRVAKRLDGYFDEVAQEAFASRS